jgi:hypothetical protein
VKIAPGFMARPGATRGEADPIVRERDLRARPIDGPPAGLSAPPRLHATVASS